MSTNSYRDVGVEENAHSRDIICSYLINYAKIMKTTFPVWQVDGVEYAGGTYSHKTPRSMGLQTSTASLEPVSVDYMRPRKYRLRVCYLVQGTARPGRQGGTNGEAYRC